MRSTNAAGTSGRNVAIGVHQGHLLLDQSRHGEQPNLSGSARRDARRSIVGGRVDGEWHKKQPVGGTAECAQPFVHVRAQRRHPVRGGVQWREDLRATLARITLSFRDN
jgi:hypothetical protein